MKGKLRGQLLKVWKQLWSHKYAPSFREPVSLEEAPDYDDVIKCRMDMSTLKKKLDNGEYNTSVEFHRDVLLMFQNAMIYNKKGSDIYKMASILKQFATKEMEVIFAVEELNKTPGTTRRSSRLQEVTKAPTPVTARKKKKKTEEEVAD